MSWLGIDCGAKRSGLAISWSGQLAEPLAVVTGDQASQIEQIERTIADNAIQTVVIGLPAGTGTDHPAHRMSSELRARLAKRSTPITVVTIDETLSTKEAERLLRSRKGNVQQSDALAACVILEQYFAEHSALQSN